MHFRKRITSVLVIVLLPVLVAAGSRLYKAGSPDGLTGLSVFDRKETVYFWYTDEAMTDFLNSAAVSFGEREGVRVIPRLAEDNEYLEAIHSASVEGKEVPDLFLLSHESLEKAYLAGLASEIDDRNNICVPENFPAAALSAVTYHGKKVAYPLSFETSALVYNRTYLEEWASQQEEQEAAVPQTLDQILEIADTFDVPEGVEGIMKWDVSDIFYNYWFTGDCMKVGGEAGDDAQILDVNNPETVACLEAYKALNQFFSIDPASVYASSVLQEFIEGKIVFTIATTDALKKLTEAKEQGALTFEYGISPLPDVSEELKSRALSVTGTVCINGYSLQKEIANEFAAYLTEVCGSELYLRTGKMSAGYFMGEMDEDYLAFVKEYEESMPLPKMMATSNYWMKLEVLFSRVWNGEEVSLLLEELENQLAAQLSSSAGK